MSHKIMIFAATKIGRKKNFSPLLFWFCCWIRDPGWIEIRLRDPGLTPRIGNTDSVYVSIFFF
jgi:hypothetical protein